MKIVIMGSGKVGHKLVEQLAQEGHDVVVIDRNPAALQDLCRGRRNASSH